MLHNIDDTYMYWDPVKKWSDHGRPNHYASVTYRMGVLKSGRTMLDGPYEMEDIMATKSIIAKKHCGVPVANASHLLSAESISDKYLVHTR